MKFDILEIQQNIEEKRQILGKKFENFLLKKITNFANYCSKIFIKKNSLFYCCFAIILTSIFASSTRDIGFISAINLEGSKGIFSIINFLANFSTIDAIILAQILFNFLGIIILVILAKFLKKSKIYQNRALYNVIIISACCGYFLRIFTLQFNEYFAFPSLERSATIYFSYFDIIKEDLFPIILLVVIINLVSLSSPRRRGSSGLIKLWIPACAWMTKTQDFMRNLLLALFALFLLGFFISLINLNYIGRSFFYSLATPLIAVLLFLLLKKKKINWRQDGLFFLACVIVPQFDPQVFFGIILNACIFWWILVLINVFKKQNPPQRNILGSFFTPHNFSSWFCFIALAANSLSLVIFYHNSHIAWIISAIIFTILIIFYEKIHHKFISEKYLSRLSVILISLILSYFLNLISVAIFNHHKIYAYNLKSPNYVSEIEASFVQKLASKNDEKVVILANYIFDIYPVFYYLGKSDKAIFDDIDTLKTKIEDNNTKLIFVEKRANDNTKCFVGFLENYFHDAKFKQFFLKNYKFIGRIIEAKDLPPQVSFFANETNSDIDYSNDAKIITRDIEIYEKN